MWQGGRSVTVGEIGVFGINAILFDDQLCDIGIGEVTVHKDIRDDLTQENPLY